MKESILTSNMQVKVVLIPSILLRVLVSTRASIGIDAQCDVRFYWWLKNYMRKATWKLYH